ncbi:hypothetical protein Agub_g5318, partial [Astrephomene gubernaculifera]
LDLLRRVVGASRRLHTLDVSGAMSAADAALLSSLALYTAPPAIPGMEEEARDAAALGYLPYPSLQLFGNPHSVGDDDPEHVAAAAAAAAAARRQAAAAEAAAVAVTGPYPGSAATAASTRSGTSSSSASSLDAE